MAPHIDADKLVDNLRRLREDSKPDANQLAANALLHTYWNAIDVAISIVIRAAQNATTKGE